MKLTIEIDDEIAQDIKAIKDIEIEQKLIDLVLEKLHSDMSRFVEEMNKTNNPTPTGLYFTYNGVKYENNFIKLNINKQTYIRHGTDPFIVKLSSGQVTNIEKDIK